MRIFLIALLLCVAAWAQSVLKVGQKVPDFTLTNQESKQVKLSDFRGKVVLVTFLYTQCPFPDKCPMLATKLDKITDLIDSLEQGKDKVQVLSVTLDPKNDTPERLKAYAQGYDRNPGYWSFLTGAPNDVAKVASLFGVVYWTEKGIIEHNMRTALIDSKGKLYKIWSGNDWKAGEMTAVIRDLLAQ